MTPPIEASSADSTMKIIESEKGPAPSAFINPTSVRRSNIAVAIAAETARADVSRAARVISSIKPSMRESTWPSFCSTWRIC